ncbi:MAG: hypothetical protein AABW56_02425 [Nanoarchaeota archaeon]
MKKIKNWQFIYVTTEEEGGIRGVINNQGVVYGLSLEDVSYLHNYEVILKEIPQEKIKTRNLDISLSPLEKNVLDALEKDLKEINSSIPVIRLNKDQSLHSRFLVY